MNSQLLNAKLIEYKEAIVILNGKISYLQTRCKHETATKIARANTGNYCPQDNSYWYEFTCPICQKHWREDQ